MTPAFQFGGSKVDAKRGDRIAHVPGAACGSAPAGGGAPTTVASAAAAPPAREVVEAVELLDGEGSLPTGATAAAPAGRGDAIPAGNDVEGHVDAAVGP